MTTSYAPPAFVHLRMHTEYSITDGIVRIDDAVARAAQEGMPALGISDLSNLFGTVKFYKACRSKGIKPIIGADIWIQNQEDRDKPFRALLICANRVGYLRLCDLITRGFRDNRYRDRAEIKPEWLQTEDNQGLIFLSGAHLGDVGQALLAGNLLLAGQRAQVWKAAFPQAFYIELQRTGDATVESYVQAAATLAEKIAVPAVATHPVQFIETDDYMAHEARTCIADGYVLADKRRPKNFTPKQSFLSTKEMQALFADMPVALQNSVHIAMRCNLSIQLGKSFLPDFPTTDGMTIDDFLVAQAQEGLQKRMLLLFPDADQRQSKQEEYQSRLKFETDTIIQMGFPGYFLIVADFINWAKHNGVPVGPGRGSGAGSLVAFSLGITDIDPLRYALLFERFLNPERVSMPDFDIDFCQDNRWRVIEYVRKTYGADAVSQIATFGTMAAKAVVRDVGRVLDLPYNFCDGISKLIPAAPGKQYSLNDALEMEPQLKERLDNEEEVQQLFALAQRLEGLTRNVGMHAGGVLIAPNKLTDFCPLYLASGDDAVPVSQFDKDDVEAVGLVKFDFLGLRNLTIIDLALKYIQQTENLSINLETLPLDDPAAYQVYRDANTTAIFQVESDGMKKLLQKLQPDRFEDIIAVLALYRPGPLNSGMVDDFILRKKGQAKIDYFHEDLTACLSPTYGVIVYQEQVMQISQIIGGYTLGAADMLRRAMGKKKPEEMAEHRGIFTAGAAKKGYDAALAERLFDLMAMFAEYGFNKSHTAAYALVSYHTAWLKAHYPAAFMAATMSADMGDTDQLKVFYDDCTDNKLVMLPPDINLSNFRFQPVSRTEIRYGLGAIKGTGEPAINEITRARQEGGAFLSLFDFCERVDKRLVNRRSLEALIKAGAFDSLHSNRASVLASLERAMDLAEQARANAQQASLFDMMDDAHDMAELLDVPDWQPKEKLQEEKLAIGFFLSGHPFTAYKAEVKQLGLVRNPLMRQQAGKEPQWLAGVITGVRTKISQRGKIAFVTLEDESGKLDVSLFSESYERYRHHIKEDALVLVKAKISQDDYSGGLRAIVDELITIEEARDQHAKVLELTLSAECSADFSWLVALLQPHQDERGCPIQVLYAHSIADCRLQLGSAWRVRLPESLIAQLRAQKALAQVEVKM